MLYKFTSRSLSSNFAECKSVGGTLEVLRENLSPKILHFAKLSFKNKEKIKAFPDKQKLVEFITTKAALGEKTLQEVLQENKGHYTA